jgi:iron complex outermembrane recepter protein
MRLKELAYSVSLAMVAAPTVFAQTALQEPQSVGRVEVTGSNIKRIADEGALPVQVITAADIEKLGVATAEQLLSKISAAGNGIDGLTTNQGSDFLNSTSQRSLPNNGASGASLRGLGAQYTLVLLNGRRVSSHALNGKSVDLNTIPLNALQRVEILKDGASAIYGTDAIGGVINFILKRDYTGVEVAASADVTEEGGGNIYRGSVLAGFGDLANDRFNLMASLSYATNNRLRGSQRDFHNGYQPERGLAPDTTGTPFATLGVAAGTAISSNITSLPGFPAVPSGYNRVNLLALTGECNTITDTYAYRGDVTGFPRSNAACVYDYGRQWSLMQPVDRLNSVVRGVFALTPEHNVFAEMVASRVKSAVEYTPIQITNRNYPAFITNSAGQQVRAPYYQDLTGIVPGFNNALPERIRWRCIECGPRQQETTTDAFRALLGMEGNFSGWDYKLGLASGQSKAQTVLGDGNMLSDNLTAALATGLINPFLRPGQTQTPEAMALIESAKARGLKLYGGKSNSTTLDASVASDLMTLPAGPLSLATGLELRKEGYRFQEDQTGQPVVLGVSAPADLDKVSRDIRAVFAELQVPITKDLSTQLAVRHDRYSDFGSTTNPKVGIRWAPTKQVVLRGSYSTGFHAPDFDALYGGDSIGQFNSDINDPVLCPTGNEPVGCGIRPAITGTSNPNLKAEKAKQYSIGVLLQPLPSVSASIDYWNIETSNRIGALSGQLLVAQYTRYSQYVIRDPATNEITEVISPTFNIAGDKLSGVDLNVSATGQAWGGRLTATLDGTYNKSFKSRFSDADPWVERVGQFGDSTYGFDLRIRWKHTTSLTYATGPWSGTLSQSFVSGYYAEVDGFGSSVTPPNAPKRIGSYTLYNLTATYTGIKNLTMTAGIKNLLNTAPPFSNHNVDNVAGAGWDGRVGDPRGRSYLLTASYKFF